MKNKNAAGKAKLFNLKHFPLDFARVLCFAIPMLFRIKKIYENDNAKKKLHGKAVIVANHTSFKDPLFLCCSFWYRRVFSLAAENVMKNKLLEFLLKGVGCIKINRNICDIESIKKSIDVLNAGHVLTLFPQGGIKGENDINTIKSGVIFIAMRSKSPIVPCYIHHKTKRGDKNCIVIGEPICLPDGVAFLGMNEIESYANKVLEKMTECKNIYEKSRRE